jgi:hypothetical protein
VSQGDGWHSGQFYSAFDLSLIILFQKSSHLPQMNALWLIHLVSSLTLLDLPHPLPQFAQSQIDVLLAVDVVLVLKLELVKPSCKVDELQLHSNERADVSYSIVFT